ncbi:MAG: hypothetical protein AB1465_04605 [Patescibacteria group bacterium]
MSVEGGGDSRAPTVMDITRRSFAEGFRLNPHAFNIPLGVEYAFRDPPPENPKRFLKHYEEHAAETYSPEDVQEIMRLSDPEAVAAFDAIIDELRQNFDAIKAAGPATVQDYCERLRTLVKPKK